MNGCLIGAVVLDSADMKTLADFYSNLLVQRCLFNGEYSCACIFIRSGT